MNPNVTSAMTLPEIQHIHNSSCLTNKYTSLHINKPEHLKVFGYQYEKFFIYRTYLQLAKGYPLRDTYRWIYIYVRKRKWRFRYTAVELKMCFYGTAYSLKMIIFLFSVRKSSTAYYHTLAYLKQVKN